MNGKRRIWDLGVCSRHRGFYKKVFLPRTNAQIPNSPFRYVLVILLILSNSLPLFAISDNVGTKNGNFLKIATDARGVALGNSIVSMAEGADALRWNPAALGLLQQPNVAATHIEYFQDVRIEHVAAAYPLEEGGIAASAFYLTAGDLDGRDLQRHATGDFKFYDLVGTLGFGRKMLSRAEGADVSIGAAVKIVQETIADQSFQNPAFDFGILASPLDDLAIGISVRNFASSKANFAREMIGGASYTLFHQFTGAFAVNYSNDAPLRYSIGGEYKIPEYETALRAGYQPHDALDNSIDSKIPALRKANLAGLTMGAGSAYKPPMWPSVRLELDYAMAPFAALGIAHTVTVKVRW